MKKISFSGLKKVMSPKEMKTILGGSGWCSNNKKCDSNSDCDWLSGATCSYCGTVKRCF